ncbi:MULTISPECIES: hypothetical protein [Fictibacillus]|nr:MULTISPECIES: hypothetical protein [Fictibacillus]
MSRRRKVVRCKARTRRTSGGKVITIRCRVRNNRRRRSSSSSSSW